MNSVSRAKFLGMVLATLIFSIMLIPAGFAAIGVKEGDWAKYKIVAEIPEIGEGGIVPFEDVEWMRFEVESVSGTTVTLEGTAHFENGTEMVETVDGIESGFITNLTEGGEVVVPFPFFGLILPFWPGEPIYTNGTASREYAGTNREVQYVEIHVGESPELDASLDLKAYWDKAKGVLCEMSLSTSAEGHTMSISVKMTETNMWKDAPAASSGQWLWTLAVVAIIVAAGLAGSAVLLWRRRTPHPEATSVARADT